jgi:ADP-ribose diphosphatase
MEKKIETLASLRCPHFSAYLDEVMLKNGKGGRRLRIEHPEASAVVPYVTGDEIIMVRQYRYALGKEILEIPAGKLDPGERPDECAKRELLEETGYEANRLDFIYTYAPAIGYSNELIHIYAAHDLKKVDHRIDDKEIDAVERVPLSRLIEMIKEGQILDGKTLIGLSVVELLKESRHHFLGGRKSGG